MDNGNPNDKDYQKLKTKTGMITKNLQLVVMIPLRMENPDVIIPVLGKRIPLPLNIIKELYIIMIIHHYKTCFITCLQNTWLVCQT